MRVSACIRCKRGDRGGTEREIRGKQTHKEKLGSIRHCKISYVPFFSKIKSVEAIMLTFLPYYWLHHQTCFCCSFWKYISLRYYICCRTVHRVSEANALPSALNWMYLRGRVYRSFLHNKLHPLEVVIYFLLMSVLPFIYSTYLINTFVAHHPWLLYLFCFVFDLIIAVT